MSQDEECLKLRRKIEELEVTFSRRETDLQEKIHVLETEMEKPKKEKNILKDNAVPTKYDRGNWPKKIKNPLKRKVGALTVKTK